MIDLILNILFILGSFFYLIFNVFMYFFAGYVILNRKQIKLGFSQMPLTTIDLIIICLIPLILTFFPYFIYHEFNPY